MVKSVFYLKSPNNIQHEENKEIPRVLYINFETPFLALNDLKLTKIGAVKVTSLLLEAPIICKMILASAIIISMLYIAASCLDKAHDNLMNYGRR